MYTRVFILICVVVACLLGLAPHADARQWTHRETGETFYAEFKEIFGEQRVVIFEEANGQRRTMQLDLLSQADVDYITAVVHQEIEYEEFGRVWTSRSSRKTVRAEFVERAADGRVYLVTEAGKALSITWESLTDADQAWVMQATSGSGWDLTAQQQQPTTDVPVPRPPPVRSDTLPADTPWHELPRSQQAEARAAVVAAHKGLIYSLYALAAITGIAGWLWLVRSAFAVSRDWGLLLLLGGPLSAGLTNVIFAIARWPIAQRGFLLWLTGALIWLVTLVFLPFWLA